jgi:hypothetical protein
MTAPRDRYLETIVQVVMKDMLRTEQFPRTLIQLTLQILDTPDEGEVDQALGLGMEDTVCSLVVRYKADYLPNRLTGSSQLCSPVPSSPFSRHHSPFAP